MADSDSSSHTYFTRSKGNITEQEQNYKQKLKQETVKSSKSFKMVNLNEDITKNYKINVTDIGAVISLSAALQNLINQDVQNSDSDSDSDIDYEPIEGLPSDFDIVYTEEEEEYLRNLSPKERQKIIQNECQLFELKKEEVPPRFKIMSFNLPLSTKSKIMDKLETYENLDPCDNEYSKLHQWFTNFYKLPFGKFSEDKPIDMKASSIIQKFTDIKQNMDNSVYGHTEAKNQIIQLLGQQISNPHLKGGGCIAIQGPPGNGKTTLIKEGICKALNRPFGFVALGGMHSSDHLVGHDYTYEGSKPGRIVEILQQCDCMNPVIYFDELDKLSESSKGCEIENLLCHMTDSSQNNTFHDKYFSEIDIDLSGVLFIFAYNDESKINPILLDRMLKINTDGFNTESKLNISKNYLLPSICKQVNFNIQDIIIDDSILKTIIEQYTNNEKGVRNLKRCLEKIVTKLNIMKLFYNGNEETTDTDNTKNDSTENDSIVSNIVESIINDVLTKETDTLDKQVSNLIDFNIPNFKLPYTMNIKELSKFLSSTKTTNMSHHMMYM